MNRTSSSIRTFGSELLSSTKTRFRLWAPDCRQVEIVIGITGAEQIHPLSRDGDGLFSGDIACGADTPYLFQLNGEQRVPDPASHCQLDSVHGASVVCDPTSYRWSHPNWRGRPWHEMVIYELHVGCCGGFDGVRQLLPHLAALGVTAIELMPIAAFSGNRNWGYDGVLPYAPANCYGSPNALKQLIDEAHGIGLCVYLDVVYNHFGPDGNYLNLYASSFFDQHRHSPWGAAIDFSQPLVRRFFTENALYWLQEFRFDGLRFDAVDQISDPHWLDETAAIVRNSINADRHVHLMLENQNNHAGHLVEMPELEDSRAGASHGEARYDAQWNDDLHNALHVLLTGERDGYYRNFSDEPEHKLARGLVEGFIYQGEVSPTHGTSRGTPSAHLPSHAFVLFLQNHDQVGNRAFGERLTTLADPMALRAAIALQLLSPQIPLLFMGEEISLAKPFLYFTDFHEDLADAVREGRRNEFQSHTQFADLLSRQRIPDPNALETFNASSIDRAAFANPSAPARESLAYYRLLLSLRREWLVPRLAGTRGIGAEVLGAGAVAASWQLGDGSRLTISINLGDAPANFEQWQPADKLLFSSDSVDHRRHLPPFCTVAHLSVPPVSTS